jgi:hypothetical protein
MPIGICPLAGTEPGPPACGAYRQGRLRAAPAGSAWPGLPDADDVACAGQLAESARRAAGLTLVALEAARTDADIAAVAAQLMAQRQVMAAWIVDGLRRRSRLRNGIDYAAAVDTVWALMDPALFCRLTRDRHWSPARFRDWFADAILRLLLSGAGQSLEIS